MAVSDTRVVRSLEAERALPAPDVAFAVGTIALLVAARAAVLPSLGLFNDEAYYWEWSRHLAPGYLDHPPAVAFLLAASTRLLGDTPLAVHLPAFALSLLTSVVLYRLVLALFPGRRTLAWTALAAVNAAPLFGLGAVFTTPDAPMLLCWAATLFLVWRATEGSPRLWYLAGATAGAGLLSKYVFVLLPASIVLWLALSRRRRGWLARKEPWLAAAIMLALFAPVVAWNAGHGWASFRLQSVDRFAGAFRPWRTLPRFLAAQQSLTPGLWLAALAGLVRSARLARRGSDAHALLAVTGGFTLAFFGVAALFTYVNPNWFGPAFVTLLVSGAGVVLGWRSPLLRAAPTAVAAAVTLLFLVQARTLAVPIPPRLDFATDLTGWPEVGERLRELVAEMPRPSRTFVTSTRFQLSALAAFYGGPSLDVTRTGGSRADAYDAWTPPGGRRGEDAVYLSDGFRFAPPDASRFDGCEAAGALDVARAGRLVRTFHFWRCFGYAPEGRAAPTTPGAR